MKKILLLVVFCMLLCAVSTAYEIRIDAPQTLRVGETIIVNGTTSLPTGISFDIILSKSEYTAELKATRHVTIQVDKNFSVEFPTAGYTRGVYKVEILPTGEYRYLGDSTTMRVVTLVDRSDEAQLTSQPRQYLTGILHVMGIAKYAANKGVQLEVTAPDGRVLFGPAFIPTNMDGSFSKDIQVQDPGVYTVALTDQKGYIGTYNLTVLEQGAVATVPQVTSAGNVVEPARSMAAQSATLISSRDEPAYFTASTGTGPVRAYTSEGADWVIEYIGDSGQRMKVNARGSASPEEVTVQGKGDLVYFEVYPNKYSEKGNVTLYVENARYVTASGEIPPGFAAAPSTPPASTRPTQASFPLFALVVAFAGFAILASRPR